MQDTPTPAKPSKIVVCSDKPTKKRKCRDVLFFLIFMAVVGGMCYCSYLAVDLGDPFRLAFGVDSWGNTCNKKNSKISGVELSGQDTRGKSGLFFFKESIFNNYVIGQPITFEEPSVCVTSCPTKKITSYVELKNFTHKTGMNYCLYGYKLTGNPLDSSHCPVLPISEQRSILFRCVPTEVSASYDFLIGFIDNMLNALDENFAQKCLSDVETTWKEICYLCGIGLGISLSIVFLMRYAAGVIIWISMILLGVGSIVITGFCWYVYSQSKDNSRSTRWLIGSICATIAMVIFLLLLLIMRKRIGLVIVLFREAGKALADMPFLLLQPLFTFLLVGAVLVIILFFYSYILTSGHPTVHSSGFVTYQKDEILQYLKWYYLVGSIWTIQFIFACDRIVISGAVGTWYFSRNKTKLHYPVLKSTLALIKYHLGSAAFGSFIITIVFSLRLLFSFVHNRVKGSTGSIIKCISRCCLCCLWCFEKILQCLNSNAYIEIAITGKSFCSSARRALKIVVGNALRLAAINSVGNFTLFLAKLSPLPIIIVVGLEMITKKTGIFYTWLPILLACLFTFLISSRLMGIYEKCIDTLFICFCEDCKMNDGDTNPYYMSAGLMKYVKTNKRKEQQRSIDTKL